jgi:ATP-dependent exoDNAse (exonuclease V) alpha subunit
MKLQKKMEKSTTLKFERKKKKEKLGGESRFPDRVMFVKNDYAKLGE